MLAAIREELAGQVNCFFLEMDEVRPDHGLAGQLAEGLPRVILINRQGHLQAGIGGVIDRGEITAKLRALIDGD